MKQIVVDTNAFLRFLLNDIPEQKRTFEKLLQEAADSRVRLVVAQIVIFEIDFILEKYYQFEKDVVIDKLKTLVSVHYLDIESREIFVGALMLYEVEDISFVDCFLAVKAKSEGKELFTFDKKLRKLN